MKPFSNERAGNQPFTRSQLNIFPPSEPPPQRPGMGLFPSYPINQPQPYFNRGPPPNNIIPPPYGNPNQTTTTVTSKPQ